MLVLVGIFGAALLYGDGMMTPAISVLAAVEGTTVATPSLEHYVVPIAFVILVGLFVVQHKGTAVIGRVFGPVMIVWFAHHRRARSEPVTTRAAVLRAIWPGYAVRFFVDNGFKGFLVLGAVILVVVGGEALYADMGHFGRRPILLGWYATRAAVSGARVLRPGRAADPRPERDRQPVLPNGTPRPACIRWWCSPRSPRSSPRRR